MDASQVVLTEEERTAVVDPVGHPDGFRSLWSRCAARAAEKAQGVNAALGIDSPGTVDGKPAVKTPAGEIVILKDGFRL